MKEERCLIKTSVKELQNLEMRTVEPLYLKQVKWMTENIEATDVSSKSTFYTKTLILAITCSIFMLGKPLMFMFKLSRGHIFIYVNIQCIKQSHNQSES